MRMPEESITFPNGFLWGVASSSYQIEGAWNEDGKGESIWDRYTHTPGNIKNEENGDIACDHYHRYLEDIALMRELGVQAYRFSTSWPRVLPEGKGAVNRAGINFYRRLVDALVEEGIDPWLCLYHWDLPQALQEEGGWTNRNIIQDFADYAGLMAHELGDKVKRWVIFNEPRCAASLGYLTGTHAPGIKNLDLALKVSHHLLLAQGKAIQTLRDISQDFQIGTVVDLNVVHPIGDDEKDQEAASKLDEYLNRWYIDPIFLGEYPPIAKEVGMKSNLEDMELIKQSLDFLGVNYYRRELTTYDPLNLLTQARVIQKKAHTTSRGWEIYPNGLYEILTRLKQDYSNPMLYVTENGAAFEDNVIKDGQIQDDDRISYLRDHIVAVRRAIKDGVQLKGYFVWSMTDNFEWGEGYSKRFGLVHIDFRTQTRTPKKSYNWYKHVIANNGLSVL